MPSSIHESDLMHVRRGLGQHNLLIDAFGGTYQASNTTIAQWKASNDAKDVPATLHESDRMLVRRANVYTEKHLSPAAIYGATQVAASNTTATWRAVFTDQDAIPAAFHGGMGDD